MDENVDKKMKKIIFLFPHPDDEAIFAGGTITRHVNAGDKVFLIWASNGERSGHSEKRSPMLFYAVYWIFGKLPFLLILQRFAIAILSIMRKPNPELLEIRKREAREAAKILDASEITFWEMEDMKINRNMCKIAELAEEALMSIIPDEIYILHPNGITDHPDHIALTKSFLEYLKTLEAEKRPLVYGVVIPQGIVKKYNLPLVGIHDTDINFEIKLNEAELAKKKLAIQAYKSQRYLWSIFLEKYPKLLEKEYFVKLY